MGNFFDWIRELRDKIHNYFDTIQQPDYTWYNRGAVKFIWGVKSEDDLTGYGAANLYTSNDIEIVYNRKTEMYSLNIDTSYWFESKKEELDYLDGLLDAFRKFMIQHNYNQNEPYVLWREKPDITFKAVDIPELYTQFQIFVEGYKAVYHYPIQGGDIFG